jgi:hypothetical protein
MSKHTPGPWLAQGRYIGVKGHMSYIGECGDQNGNWTNEPMAVANARLIAAAPDLLEALIAMINHYTGLINSGDAGNWDPETESKVIIARAAIAKAQGETA